MILTHGHDLRSGSWSLSGASFFRQSDGDLCHRSQGDYVDDFEDDLKNLIMIFSRWL